MLQFPDINSVKAIRAKNQLERARALAAIPDPEPVGAVSTPFPVNPGVVTNIEQRLIWFECMTPDQREDRKSVV